MRAGSRGPFRSVFSPLEKHKKHGDTVLSCLSMRVGDRGFEPLTSTMQREKIASHLFILYSLTGIAKIFSSHMHRRFFIKIYEETETTNTILRFPPFFL